MQVTNRMAMEFPSLSRNESFARQAVAAFALQAGDWTLNDLDEITTAVSEAVTNAIIHGYEDGVGDIRVEASILDDRGIEVIVIDYGVGIEDVDQALEPMFTTKPEQERTGMGFSFMQSFMDDLEVISAPGRGTRVRMVKWLASSSPSGSQA
ncbi:MAG: anti-sigma F factor [Bacillota bacterium]|jgi:stage II sporulation protein AB (anti-sigma F factor)